jgi:hypothetical protein
MCVQGLEQDQMRLEHLSMLDDSKANETDGGKIHKAG